MAIVFGNFLIWTSIFLIFLIWLAYTRVKGAEYAPTNYKTAKKMLELAKITKKDIVYELGSGLGGLSLLSARKARKVIGIEYDFIRVLISRIRAKLKKVKNIEFVCEDIFYEDISKANVVLMFLKQKTNQKLKSKLNKLKRGTRIISNTWTFEGWKAVKEDKNNKVYLYIIGKSN